MQQRLNKSTEPITCLGQSYISIRQRRQEFTKFVLGTNPFIFLLPTRTYHCDEYTSKPVTKTSKPIPNIAVTTTILWVNLRSWHVSNRKVTGYSSSPQSFTATGTHVPYGITQYYLPPGRGDIPAFTPAG